MLMGIRKGSLNALPVIAVIFILIGGIWPEAYAYNAALTPKDSPSKERTLSLDQVISLALLTNRSIKESAYSVESQKYAVMTAESEFEWKYAPSSTATATSDASRLGTGVTLQKKTRLGPSFRVTPELVFDNSYEYDNAVNGQVDVSVTVPLLKGWGKEANQSSIDAAHYSTRSIKRSHDQVKVNVVLDAISAVYDILEQQELLKINQLETQNFEKHTIMASAKEKIGLANPMDVYRAQIRLKDAQDQLSRTHESLQSSLDRLKLILSIPFEDSINISAPMDCHPLLISVQEAVSVAFNSRPELKQAADEISYLEQKVKTARHNLKPQLDIVGHYNHLGLDERLQSDSDLDQEYWSVSLVSESDWRRTSEKADYQKALLAVRAAKLNRWTVMDTIRRQVRQEYDSLLKAEERMQIRKEQIQQAEGKLALAQLKFNHAMADNFNVIEAQTELQSARSNFLAAKMEYIVGRYNLKAAMGALLEDNVDTQNKLPQK